MNNDSLPYAFLLKLIHFEKGGGKNKFTIFEWLPLKVYPFTARGIFLVTADNSTLRIAYLVYIQSLTAASGSTLFGSVVEHWIIDPAAWVQFSRSHENFFSLICYALFFVTAFM